jgi:hypothetical protein
MPASFGPPWTWRTYSISTETGTSVVDIADYLCRTVDEVQAKIDEVEAKIASRKWTHPYALSSDRIR